MSNHEPCDWTPGGSEPRREADIGIHLCAGFCLSSDWKPEKKKEKLISSSLPPMVGRKQEVVGCFLKVSDRQPRIVGRHQRAKRGKRFREKRRQPEG